VRGKHDAAVPILMYHAIGTPPPTAPYPGLYISAKAFTAQVDWLAAQGYHAVTVRQVYDFWKRGRPLPRKPVVLSFDDGYPGQVSVALRVLRAHHWVGVLNLQVGNLVPSHVRRLISSGWEIDAHTFTHPNLTTVDPARLRREVAGSRRWIRRMFGVRVDFFCYPAGRYNRAVVRAVRAAGYLGATTTMPGLARPSNGLFTLNRIRISGNESVSAFASTLKQGN
jgi:peptidoglycan/xylan/chitin deacetylase (PgdA/CDA1 family)